MQTVVQGILETIRRADEAGNVAWAVAAKLKGFELLGRHLGMFTEKVEVGFDQKIMDLLTEGRRRAAGLSAGPIVANAEENSVSDESVPVEEKQEPKPN